MEHERDERVKRERRARNIDARHTAGVVEDSRAMERRLARAEKLGAGIPSALKTLCVLDNPNRLRGEHLIFPWGY